MLEREALETGKALIDCGATRSMGFWEALDGVARMNEQDTVQLVFLWILRRRRGTLLQLEKGSRVNERSLSR